MTFDYDWYDRKCVFVIHNKTKTNYKKVQLWKKWKYLMKCAILVIINKQECFVIIDNDAFNWSWKKEC